MPTDLMTAGSTTDDYTSVTEMTGYNVTQEQIDRMYARYRFASEFCKGKDVLEIACGSGQGLGYLAKHAKRVVGGDYDIKMVECANKHYGGAVEILQIDAHDLPFEDGSFDVIILYEAIYYLSEPKRFIREARRVLGGTSTLIVGTANKDWPGFNPSPFSYKYFSANELFLLLKENGFETRIFADCPVASEGLAGKLVSIIKQIAVKLHVIPKTMKGKEKLKRLFMGKLTPLPPEIADDMGITYSRPVQIAHDKPSTQHKVLIAIAQLNTA